MDEFIRINKYLSEIGYCSRREADRLIAEGLVRADGITLQIGEKIRRNQEITVGSQRIAVTEQEILLVYHKPRGIVCTTDQREPMNIIKAVGYPDRIYPVGRLDKDSEGLILLTNQGDLVNKIMRSGNRHEKEYIVTVDQELSRNFLSGMAKGVPILDTVTRPCLVERISQRTFRIVLTQGLNRQIRRMCEYFGYQVKELKRIRIMNICLGDLPKGSYRDIGDEEWRTLLRMVEKSSAAPVIGVQ